MLLFLSPINEKIGVQDDVETFTDTLRDETLYAGLVWADKVGNLDDTFLTLSC